MQRQKQVLAAFTEISKTCAPRRQEPSGELEEERRLLFVGITRAQQQLQLSRCLNRFRKQGMWPSIASRFLMELPREIMSVFEPSANDPWVNEDDPDVGNIDPWMHEGTSSEYDEDVVQEQSPRPGPVRAPAFPRLVTAADLAQKHGDMNAIRAHPEVFRMGMSVEHPEYGTGRIIDLSGSGVKRVATVDFPSLGKRRFRLSHADLQPSDNPEQ